MGLQIAFAFYLTALAGFTAPTELAPARDRFGVNCIGDGRYVVCLTNVAGPHDHRDAHMVASVLTDASRVISIVDSGLSHADNPKESDRLRDRLGKQLPQCGC